MNASEQQIKPGYSLIKYGDLLTFNCNRGFAERLSLVLTDYLRENKNEEVKEFADSWKDLLNDVEDYFDADNWKMTRFEHVFTMTLSQSFSLALNKVLGEFLQLNRVSPALYSFAKQLTGYLYPKRNNTKYADEY